MKPDTVETDLQGFVQAENEDYAEQTFSLSGEELNSYEYLSE